MSFPSRLALKYLWRYGRLHISPEALKRARDCRVLLPKAGGAKINPNHQTYSERYRTLATRL